MNDDDRRTGGETAPVGHLPTSPGFHGMAATMSQVGASLRRSFGPLPDLPDSAYPPGAEPLEEVREEYHLEAQEEHRLDAWQALGWVLAWTLLLIHPPVVYLVWAFTFAVAGGW